MLRIMALSASVISIASLAPTAGALPHMEDFGTWKKYRQHAMKGVALPKAHGGNLTVEQMGLIADHAREVRQTRRTWARMKAVHHREVVAAEEAAAEEAAEEAAEQPEETVPEQPEETETVTTGGVALCDAACIQCESGGDPNAWNGTSYWGLYQFDEQTWYAHGGPPGTWGNGSSSLQHQIAANVTYDAWPSC